MMHPLNDPTFAEALHQTLLQHEGHRTHPYRDTVGKITIGIGRNLTDRGLSSAEIKCLYDTDVRLAAEALDDVWPDWHNAPHHAQIALLSMAFNLGLPRLRGFRKMRAALHRHDFEEAAIEAQDSKWAHQTGHRATHITVLLRRAAQQ